MAITAACDVCRHKYQVPESRLGELKTCKQCHSEFELDEYVEEEKNAAEQGPSVWQQTWEWIGHGGSAVMVVAVVGVLVGLLWIDPQERALAGNRSAGSRLPASSRSLADNTYRPPVVPRVPSTPAPSVSNVRPNQPTPLTPQNTSRTTPNPFPANHPNIQSNSSIAQNSFPKSTPSIAPAVPAINPPAIPGMVDFSKQQEEFRKRHEQMMEQHRKSFEQMRRPGFGQPPSFGTPFGHSGSSSSNNSGPKISDKLDYSGPNPLRPSGKEVQFVRQLKKGQVVLAERDGFWYPAEVVGVQAGRVFVHYRGQKDNSWDGVVTREQLQLPHDDAKIE